MDPTSIQQTKLMEKKYKLPYESPGKRIGDLKSEIIRRLQAVKINATPEKHHLVDKDGAQLFEEDLVADLIGVIDEVQLVKSTQSPTTQAPSSQSTQINQQSGNLTNLLQNLRNALQNSGGIHRIPPNLLQTIQHGTFRSTLSNLRGPTQNQAPSLPPRDYYKEIYETAKIDKDPGQNIEKVFAMQFLPPITDMIEESKDNIGEMEEPINLSYRIIQSQKYLAIEKIRTFKKETLEELSERIVKKNGYDTNLFRGALYNNEGVPLTKNLMLLVSLKVEDVLNDNDNIYVVLTPSQVDTKTLPKIDHNSGKDQILVNHNGTHIIRIDLSTATVSELKQKIYHKHDVPTSLQSLFYGGKPLNDTHTLDQYGIQSNSNVHLTIRAGNASDSWGFQSNFHSPNLVHTKLQSIKGIREFRSHLMSIIAQICSSYTQQYTTKLLGYIRDLTQNNAPFVYSLYSLLRKGTLTLTQKIALEEGFLLLFSNVLLRSPQRPKNIVAAQDTVFEHSRAIFSAIFSYLDSLNEVPQLWKDREHYVPTETICALTFQNLKHPVGLRFDDGRIKICEKSAVMQLINNHQQIPGIQALTEDLLIAVPEVERALQFQRFSGVQSLDLWKPKNIEIQDKTLLISDWLDLINKAQAHKLLKIYSALEIKNNAPEYSLTFNQQKELILYSGKNKDVRKPIEVFDVIQGGRTAVNADDLADALANWQSQLVLEPVINRTPKEAIIVLLDISGSMKNQYFDVAEMDRLSAVKAFFNSFADRTMAYDFHHVISLVLFNNKLTLKCDFTELFTQFKAVIETARAGSTTALYDALCFGVERLNLFQQKYPHIVKRIIALTDGEDTASKKTASAAARAIQENNVILDSFVVGEECYGLKKITFATGGYCFCPKTLNDAMRLFEGETILRASIREERPQNSSVKNDQDLEKYASQEFSKYHIPIKLPTNINAPVTRPKNVIRELASNKELAEKINPSTRLKRIVREIHNYTSDPHPFIQIFPGKEDISFWKVLLKGPEATPYAGGAFILYVTFSGEYPREPPNIRFLTPIYHCNINSQGRICHSVLDRNYTVDTTMKVIFDCIFGLLLTPEPEDPLDNYLATEFLSEREKYEEHARKLTESKAGKNLDALIVEFLGVEATENQEDVDLQEKMKDFENWLAK